jgi:hypothetical protein
MSLQLLHRLKLHEAQMNVAWEGEKRHQKLSISNDFVSHFSIKGTHLACIDGGLFSSAVYCFTNLSCQQSVLG